MTVRKSPNHMEARNLARGSLEYFPTPPWATRTVINEILRRRLCLDLRTMSASDPCCGEGHMVRPLEEAFGTVQFSDVHDWGMAPPIRDFTFETRESLIADGLAIPDWIFINPPFEIAPIFLLKALEIAGRGVAMFIRLGWLSGQGRYHRVFGAVPPSIAGVFSERVALIEGAYDPEASTATDYIWLVWEKPAAEFQDGFQTVHFPPGRENWYWRSSDEELAKRGEAKRRSEARKAAQSAGVG